MGQAAHGSISATGIRVAVPLIALAYVIGLVPLPVGRIGDPITTFASTGPAFAALDLLAGMGLIVVGTVAWLGITRVRVGLLAVLAGVAWFGLDLASSGSNRAEARAIGQVVEPFLLPLLIDLVVAVAPDGRRRATGRFVVGVYCAAAIVAVVRVATYDPFFDPNCLTECVRTPTLVASGPELRWLLRITRPGLSLVASLWLILYALHRLVRGRSPSSGLALTVAGGVVVGLAAGARAALQLRTSAVDPRDPVQAALFVALALGTTLLSVGLAWLIVNGRRTMLRVRRIADGMESAPAPGSFQTALSVALEDGSVTVGYWLADEGRYVDAEGGTFAAGSPAASRAESLVRRNDEPIAVVRHRAGLDGPTITGAIGPAMLVALDNERLRATALAQLREIRASRARIVEVGDTERRRIERDLHDGAQQRLLTISFDLRLARLAADGAGAAMRSERLAGLEELAFATMEELRKLARGIHPGVLSQAGLEFALASLAEDAPIPVAVSTELHERPPASVETAAYQVVVEALAEALRRGAGDLTVHVTEYDGRLVVETLDDADAPLDLPVRVADRVGAGGGELMVGERPLGRGGFIRAELPCG